MCRLELKRFITCDHKIWVRKEAFSRAFADVRYNCPPAIASRPHLGR